MCNECLRFGGGGDNGCGTGNASHRTKWASSVGSIKIAGCVL